MSSITNGTVAHAGTFNSHPVAMAAADAVLRHLDEQRDAVYPPMIERGQRLMAGLRASAAKHGVPFLVDGPGPVFQTYITNQDAVTDYRSFVACDRAAMSRLHEGLMAAGVNIVPRGLWLLSTEHTDAQVDETLAIADHVMAAL